MMALLLCAASIANLVVSCDSYERKMERLNKVASEFKATLSPNNQILAERIDSTAQKVFYLEPDEEGYGDASIKNIKVHDYTTNETKSILPESGSIEDFEFCGIEYKGSKVIKDRLFIKLQSDCMWRLESRGVFYINMRDNSLHYIESCDDATFLEKGEIEISKFYYLGEGEYGREETERKQYTLSTSLSDEAYADNRQEQKRIEERLAEEWKNRDIERIIELDYTITKGQNYIDNIGCLDRSVYGLVTFDFVVWTNSIVVPQGKVWQFKRFQSSGYGYAPKLRYYKVVNRELIPTHGREIPKDVQVVLYPGTYKFSITEFTSSPEPGHRKAKIIFTEKVY